MNKFLYSVIKKGFFAIFSSGLVALLLTVTSLGTVQASYIGQTAQLDQSTAALTSEGSGSTLVDSQVLVSGVLAQTNDTTPSVISTTDQNIMNRYTADFHRAVQKLNIDFGRVSRGMVTQNRERAYTKELARGLFDTTLVQQAFDAFNRASGAASSGCYKAESQVLGHTGFDVNGTTVNISDAGTTLTTVTNDLVACESAYQTAYSILWANLMTAYQGQKNMPEFSIPTTGDGAERITFPIDSIEVKLITGLGTNKLQDLTSAFIRQQQVARKYEGYVTLTNNTMNQEHSYLKMLERNGFDITLVQQAFNIFDQSAAAAIKGCGPAETVVTARAGFDVNNVVTSQNAAQNTVSTAAADLPICHDAMVQSFNTLHTAFLNLGLQIHGLPTFGAPTIN